MKKEIFIQTHAASKASLPVMMLLVLMLAGCASTTSDTTNLSGETADAQSTGTAADNSADAADTVDVQNAGTSADTSADSPDAAADSFDEQNTDTTDDSTEKADPCITADSSETAYTYPVSEEEALAIALEDAGLEEDTVTVTISELIVEEAYACWSIEFYSDITKYDYEIDANTGEMLSRTVRSTEQ